MKLCMAYKLIKKVVINYSFSNDLFTDKKANCLY